MTGLRYQKEKANLAAYKVGELKGALAKYVKVNTQGINVEVARLEPMQPIVSDANLEYDLLPSISLTESPILAQTTAMQP